MSRKPAFFYGWIIVAVIIVCMIVGYGVRHSFSVFFPPILDEFGWSRGSTALMFSLNILFYGLAAPIVGSVGDRWNPRRVMPFGALLLALATAGCALASELWHFYLLFGVLMPVGLAFTGWPVFAPSLANWFVRRRGMVMGLGTMGGGLSFTVGMFVEHMISLVDWRWTFVVMGGLVVGIVIPMVLLLFYSRPEQRGLAPYGAEALQYRVNEGRARSNASMAWTLSQVLRSYRLWMLFLSLMLYWGIGNYMVVAHQVRFAEDMGYSSAFAASVFGFSGIFLVLGMLFSFLADRLGREKTLTLATISSIISLFILILIQDNSQPWLLYIHALLFGFGAGLVSPIFAAGTADIFYGKNFGAVFGIVVAGMGVGGAIGPWLGGFIYDVFGSYFWAFIVCIATFCMACLCFWIAAPRKGR